MWTASRPQDLLVQTSHIEDKDRRLANGMDGYITKPVQPEDLFREIDRLRIAYTPVESPSAASPTCPGKVPSNERSAIQFLNERKEHGRPVGGRSGMACGPTSGLEGPGSRRSALAWKHTNTALQRP